MTAACVHAWRMHGAGTDGCMAEAVPGGQVLFNVCACDSCMHDAMPALCVLACLHVAQKCKNKAFYNTMYMFHKFRRGGAGTSSL